MNIKPLQDRVVVKRLAEEEKARAGSSSRTPRKRSPRKARSWPSAAGKLDNGSIQPMDVKKGDRILFSKYAGTEIKIDGDDFLIMREDDILGVVER
ncbi:MAG: co-chaperone GroES [Deltaproteobacteria bacterium]|nr:co-chaperone GroES [Deltaproteobacteria bacterium]